MGEAFGPFLPLHPPFKGDSTTDAGKEWLMDGRPSMLEWLGGL